MAALLCVAAGGAYATLPYWAPAGAIGRYLSGQMSRQMQTPVRIGRFSLSWSRGVEITDLEVDAPAGFKPGAMVHVDRIRAEFSPVEFFLHDRIGWMEIEGPRAFVQVDQAGNVNLHALSKLRFKAQAERIGVSRAGATVQLPGDDKLLAIGVSDAQYVAGMARSFGRLTVSAVLDQQESSAPVSLHLTAGSGDRTVQADALFNFANLHLDQLPLPQLLGLPLNELSGLCRGSLNLQTNRQGVVDQLSLELSIRDLKVLPKSGPTLPVIPEAGLRVAAAFDPVTENLEAGLVSIQSASVRLPGIDLAGKASLTTEILSGRWEAFNSLRCAGTIYPDRLAALVGGRQELPGGLTVTGPVGVRLAVERSSTVFDARVSIDAGSTEVLRWDDVIKPSQRPLALEMAASLDRRNWRLSVDKAASKLLVGRNVFAGGGTISDVRRLFEPLDGGAGWRFGSLLQRLGLLEWEGSCHVTDLHSLASFWSALEGVDLDGAIEGKLSIQQFPDTQVQLGMLVSPETRLAVGGVFDKRGSASTDGQGAAAVPLSLEASAKVFPDEPVIRLLDVDVVCGDGRIGISQGRIDFGKDQGAVAKLSSDGNIDGAKVEQLLAMLPIAGWPPAAEIAGDMAGRYRLELADERLSVDLDADIEKLAASWGDLFRKPVGRKATASLRLSRELQGQAAGGVELALWVSCPEAKLSAAAKSPAGAGGSVNLEGKASVTDAGWLLESSPALAAALPEAMLSGSLEVRATAEAAGDELTATLEADADGLGFEAAMPQQREKKPGVPLRLKLAGGLAGPPDDRKVRLEALDVELGGAKAYVTGQGDLAMPTTQPAKGAGWPPLLGAYRADVSVDASSSAALKSMFPELADLAARYGLSGSFHATAGLTSRQDEVLLTSSFDLTGTEVGHLGPYSFQPGAGGAKSPAVELGPFRKPAGMPAGLDVEITVRRGRGQVQLNNLLARIGDVEVLADGLLNLPAVERGKSLPGLASAHVAVWVPNAETLEDVWPGLGECRPAGEAFLDCQVSSENGEPPQLAALEFQAGKLAWRRGGKDCSVSGALSMRDVNLSGEAGLEIGQVRTDGLEMRVGESHVWVMADLRNLPNASEGQFQIIGEYLNDKDLAEFLAGGTGGEAGLQVGPPAGLNTGPATRPSRQEGDALLTKASGWMEILRRYSAQADIDGQVSLDRFRTYDQAVDRTYEARQLRLYASMDRGQLTADYVAGINGGTIRGTYGVRLADAEPVVAYETSVEEVIATDDIQPQLAKCFPGNTVYGLFNRTEQSAVPLRDVLAQAIDHRHPLHQTGVAKTMTTDGLVKGKAAPRFVTRIFPGLNLTEYRYETMTGFATFCSDGVAENDMVFSGQTYDIYIEGATDVENIGRYEVGLILLGTPQSAEWNHAYKQGRIPLLKLKARIENGRMYDEEVTYPWPNESLFVIFLRNNIFYRVWMVANGK